MQVATLIDSIGSPDRRSFPLPPIIGNTQLVPIRSWYEMYLETLVTGVEFDNFWFESVADEVAYFFRWPGNPRSTILTIWSGEKLVFIECRTLSDVLVEGEALEPIQSMVIKAFQQAGYGIQLGA